MGRKTYLAASVVVTLIFSQPLAANPPANQYELTTAQQLDRELENSENDVASRQFRAIKKLFPASYWLMMKNAAEILDGDDSEAADQELSEYFSIFLSNLTRENAAHLLRAPTRSLLQLARSQYKLALYLQQYDISTCAAFLNFSETDVLVDLPKLIDKSPERLALFADVRVDMLKAARAGIDTPVPIRSSTPTRQEAIQFRNAILLVTETPDTFLRLSDPIKLQRATDFEKCEAYVAVTHAMLVLDPETAAKYIAKSTVP